MKMCFSCWFRLTVFAAFLLLTLRPAYGQPARRVTWADLPEHLDRKAVPIEDVAVRDCPRGIEANPPDRVVAQWIENTFYLWNEYDVVDRGESAQSIVMVKPEAKPLSAAEARTLLTASTLWRTLVPTARDPEETLDPSDPALDAIAKPLPQVSEADLRVPDRAAGVPEEAVSREAQPMSPGRNAPGEQPADEDRSRGVIGSDGRVRVTNTKAFPWYLQCYLRQKYGSRYYRGTGCAVTPYMILTCAHNVYDQDGNCFADSMTIVPGQKQYSPGGTVYRPWGTRSAAWFRCNSPYTSGGTWAYDYAAVHFEYPFWSIATYIPVEFNTCLSEGDVLNMAGYPSVAQNSRTFGQWYCNGEILRVYDRIIHGNFDTTGGNSGSAMYYYLPSQGVRRIAGILAMGAKTYNGGPRLVSQNKDLIIGWMQWTPGRAQDSAGAAPEHVAAGAPFTVTTEAGQGVELLIGAAPEPDQALLRLRYDAPTFLMEFGGEWMPIGIPNAVIRSYGKGVSLNAGTVANGQVAWTLQHSLDEGEFAVYQQEGDSWKAVKRVQCGALPE